MERFYEFMSARDRIDQSGGAVLRVTGDKQIPLMDALLELRSEQPEMLEGLVDVIPADGETLRFLEVRQFRPPYLKALGDISQFLQANGYQAASKFLDVSFELQKMTKWYIIPVVGQIYTDRNGQEYRCIRNNSYSSDEDERRELARGKHVAIMEPVKSSHMLRVHGVWECEDGTIGWDNYTFGHYSKKTTSDIITA